MTLRDRRAAASVEAVIGHTVAAGSVLALDGAALEALRGAFASGAARSACAGCEWADLCTAMAARGYASARVALG